MSPIELTFANIIYLLTTDPIIMFWNEIDLIQKRHALFFPLEQKEFILLQELDNWVELIFLEEYNLSSVITMEIKLAFKLAFGK